MEEGQTVTFGTRTHYPSRLWYHQWRCLPRLQHGGQARSWTPAIPRRPQDPSEQKPKRQPRTAGEEEADG
jgi:hypothetical protein